MQAVILAAGESSRFWPLNQKHKSLIKIMGRPLIFYTIEKLRKSGIKDIIVIQCPKKDIEQELNKYRIKIKYVIQPKPKSTGDAIWQARKLIKENFIVIGPQKIDLDQHLPLILRKAKQNPKKIILVGAETETPWDYGVFKFKNNKVVEIVENPKRGKEPSNIKSTEIYIFPLEFFDYYKKVPQKEDNLIGTINLFIEKEGVELVLLKEKTISLKNLWNLLDASEYLLKNIKTNIKGRIENGCKISGPVIIEKGSLIKSGTYIEGPVYIGQNCRIGPNCYIKNFTNIGNDCHIGNGTEIKNSIIGNNSKIPHLSYVGDSVIGENCNLGAGTIIANLRFDKKTIKSEVKGELIDTKREKFGCVLGDNTQTGINCSIMPGVFIGYNCIIGPHSVVFGNLKDNARFFTEFKGVRRKKIHPVK